MSSADRNFINSLANGLEFLMSFTKDNPRLSLTELAKANAMNLPTARRYIHTLAKLGFIVKDEKDQTFQLTAKVMRLGSGVFSSMNLRERLLPFMRNINRGLDVTTHCAILDGTEVVNIERLRSKDVVNLDITVGTRLPAYATSLGKAILAFLPKTAQKSIIRQISFRSITPMTITDPDIFLEELRKTNERGYAIAVQELTLGLKTMAVPILNGDRTVKAAFGVSYPMHREKDDIWEGKLIKSILTVKDQLGLF